MPDTAYAFDDHPLLKAVHGGWQLTLPAGRPSVELPLLFFDDGAEKQSADRIAFHLQGSDESMVIDNSGGLVFIILDPYVPPMIQIQTVDKKSVTEGEVLVLDIVAQGKVEKPLTVPFSVISGGAEDVSTDPAEYVQFAIGQKNARIEMNASADGVHEGDKAIGLGLEEGADYALGSQSRVDIELIDADPPPRFSMKAAKSVVNNNEDLQIILTATGASDTEQTVPFSIKSLTDLPAQARLPLPESSHFRLPAGSTAARQTVPLAAVPWPIGNHQLKFTLDNKIPVPAPGDRTAHAAVMNTPVRLDSTRRQAEEQEPQPIDLHLRLPPNATAAQDIPVVVHGSGSAKYKEDFQASGGDVEELDDGAWQASMVIPAGQSQARLQLRAIDDKRYEGDETIEVTITESLAGINESEKSVTIKIADDEPPPSVTLSADKEKVLEGEAAELTIRVAAGGETDLPIQGSLSISGAKEPQDYEISRKQFEIPAGEYSDKIRLEATDDSVPDRDHPTKTITIAINELVNASPAAPQSLDLQLVDNDVWEGRVLLLVAHTHPSAQNRDDLEEELKEVVSVVQNDLVGGQPQWFDKETFASSNKMGAIKEDNAIDEKHCSTVLNRALEVEEEILDERGKRPFKVILLYPTRAQNKLDRGSAEFNPERELDRKVFLVGAPPFLETEGDIFKLMRKYAKNHPDEKIIHDDSDLANTLIDYIQAISKP